MTNRLEQRTAELRSADRRGLAPFVTAGDGGPETTVAVLRALDRAGVACVELGLPFSDPIADGPVLQAASERALTAGTNFEVALQILRELRSTSDLPVALMSYANPLLRRGLERACRDLAQAGADALLVADLPFDEGDELVRAARAAGLSPIFFAAPTSPDERIARAAGMSRGFLYAIGRTGVTGRPTELDGTSRAFLERVRRAAGELPVALGFGIASPAQVRAASREADLVVVGSALVERVHREAGGDPAAAARAAGDFVRELIGGLP